MMTLTMSPWLVWAVLCLALFGVVFWVQQARRGVRDLRAWWRDRRDTFRMEDFEDAPQPRCPDCGGTEAHEWDCPVDPALDPLPPERSWEELTEDRPAPALVRAFDRLRDFEASRERRVPKWEAVARSHYVAMGLEYPSGLLARVREAAP